jgi:hypothetical protein
LKPMTGRDDGRVRGLKVRCWYPPALGDSRQFVILDGTLPNGTFRAKLGRLAVPKTPPEIAAKAQEIYALASNSLTPISVLSLQSTILLGDKDWTALDVERVSSEVMGLLIRHGWKKPSA